MRVRWGRHHVALVVAALTVGLLPLSASASPEVTSAGSGSVSGEPTAAPGGAGDAPTVDGARPQPMDAAPASVLDPSPVCSQAEPAGFDDRGTVHASAIDCLTFYSDVDGDPIVRGFADGTFGTGRSIERGQFASLLLGFLTVTDPTLAGTLGDAPVPYPDARGSTHASAIGALTELGVFTGRADGTFGAGDPVSRGAAATTLARALEIAGVGLPDRPRSSFDDQGDVHWRAIGQLTDLGLIAGVGDGRFATFDDLTRGQVATLLARSAQLLDDQEAWAPDPTTGRPPAEGWEPPQPRPTPASTHPPRTLAAVGDSITQASGASREGEGILDVLPGTTQPARSWATGTADGLDSVLQRLRALEPAAVGENVSEEGRRMRHAVEQVERIPPATDLITIQLGGNDLCRPTVAEMTSPDAFEAQLREALELAAAERPAALVQVSSVPDIYRLWEVLRDDPVALAFWNGTGALPPVVPCQSLLADARSDDPADQARRDAVRERSQAFNARAEQVCAEFVRCRFDDAAVWEFSNDPSRFGAEHISAVDFFHPSFTGQRDLAAVAWEAGFDWTEETPPVVDVEAEDGAVVVTASSAAGVAGVEWRTVSARALRGSWTSRPTEEVTLPLESNGGVNGAGGAVEVRAVDVNGNVSTSRVIAPPR